MIQKKAVRCPPADAYRLFLYAPGGRTFLMLEDSRICQLLLTSPVLLLPLLLLQLKFSLFFRLLFSADDLPALRFPLFPLQLQCLL